MQVIKYMFQPHGDDRGQLVALEEFKDIPFRIKRVYYMYDTVLHKVFPDARFLFPFHYPALSCSCHECTPESAPAFYVHDAHAQSLLPSPKSA